MNNDEQPSTTDRAIDECDEMIRTHRKASSVIISVGGAVLFSFFVMGLAAIQMASGAPQKPINSPQTPLEATKSLVASAPAHATSVGTTTISTQLPNSVLLGFFAIIIIVFSVIMSIYRFHLNEISKAEHYKIGFMRIRIAASNSKPQYQSEVRTALTERAFAYEAPSHGLFKNKHIESPLPGHPTTDISAHLLDKLLDKFELVESKKKTEVNKE